jgi:hypothetical protein
LSFRTGLGVLNEEVLKGFGKKEVMERNNVNKVM